MSFWSRIENVFRGDCLNREIDEEMNSHIEEAIAEGMDPAEAKKAFGSLLRQREASRDIRMAGWVESVLADTVFGWRQLRKRKAASAAAIVSLAFAIGACTSVFRVIDALLLRPLPVAVRGSSDGIGCAGGSVVCDVFGGGCGGGAGGGESVAGGRGRGSAGGIMSSVPFFTFFNI